MPYFNHATRTVHFKIIYWGPPGAGRRTCVREIAEAARIATGGRSPDRFFASETVDASFPPRVAAIGDYAVYIEASALASGAAIPESAAFTERVDAVVFVADPRSERAQANRDAIAALNASTAASAPRVLQINRQDVEGIITREEILAILGDPSGASWGAVMLSCAIKGEGILPTLREALRRPYVAARA